MLVSSKVSLLALDNYFNLCDFRSSIAFNVVVIQLIPGFAW